MFELQVGGHGRLGRLQAGLQARELSRHVEQLMGEWKRVYIIWFNEQECI